MKLCVDREGLGEAFHTALRKLCDGHASSAMWNVIYLLPPESWGDFLDWLWKALNDAPEGTGAVRWLKRENRGSWYVGKPPLAAMHCLLLLFTDDEWHNALAWILAEPQ